MLKTFDYIAKQAIEALQVLSTDRPLTNMQEHHLSSDFYKQALRNMPDPELGELQIKV